MNHGHRFLLGSMVVGLLAAALALLAAGEPPLLAAEAERPLGQKTAAPNMAEPTPMSAEIKNKAWDAEAAATLEDIPNGDFELGHIYWQELSSSDWPLIYYQEDAIVDAHGGEWLAWLGGWTLETSLIQQEVTIPTDRPVLDYWHWIFSEHECGHDVARVRLNGTAVDQYDLCDTVNTGGWVQHTVSLAAYAGQTVMLGIEVQTTESTFSSLFLDDLTLMPVSVIYVDADADPDGDGESWESAYTDLQSALADAEAGEQIWVAAGTYKPSEPFIPEDPRSVAFQMQNEAAIYGGFDPSAGATGWADRNWETYVTILSGDIGIEGDPADNSYHVFYHPSGTGLDDSAILDGFTITGGNANGAEYADRFGAGMYNDGSSPVVANCTFEGNLAQDSGGGMWNTNSSSPELTNCTFAGNLAGWGGGMVNYSSSSPTLAGCTFEGNSALVYGGGMWNYENSAPQLTGCTFSGNSAEYGGGIYNQSSAPTLVDCTFSGNEATNDGGAVFNEASAPTLTGCTFVENSASASGGGMHNMSASSPTLTNCTFSGNWAIGSGGGMHNAGSSSPSLTGCTFQGNTADTEGGGIHNDASSPILTGCTFSENTADAGGGIYNGNGSLPELMDVAFEGNSADSGGGMHNSGSSPELVNCTFTGNSVGGSGGGMFNDGSSPVVINCTFTGNSADGNGGGMRNKGSSAPTLTNCTFQGNRATNGGAIHNIESSAPTLTNCILWGDAKPEIVDQDSSAIVTYSDVQGSYTYPGTGNINADPLFVDPDSGNLHLRPGSPCIDTGTGTAPYLPAEDFEGDPRILDGDRDGDAVVDMGVDEALWVPVYLPVVLRGY